MSRSSKKRSEFNVTNVRVLEGMGAEQNRSFTLTLSAKTEAICSEWISAFQDMDQIRRPTHAETFLCNSELCNLSELNKRVREIEDPAKEAVHPTVYKATSNPLMVCQDASNRSSLSNMRLDTRSDARLYSCDGCRKWWFHMEKCFWQCNECKHYKCINCVAIQKGAEVAAIENDKAKEDQLAKAHAETLLSNSDPSEARAVPRANMKEDLIAAEIAATLKLYYW